MWIFASVPSLSHLKGTYVIRWELWLGRWRALRSSTQLQIFDSPLFTFSNNFLLLPLWKALLCFGRHCCNATLRSCTFHPFELPFIWVIKWHCSAIWCLLLIMQRSYVIHTFLRPVPRGVNPSQHDICISQATFSLLTELFHYASVLLGSAQPMRLSLTCSSTWLFSTSIRGLLRDNTFNLSTPHMQHWVTWITHLRPIANILRPSFWMRHLQWNNWTYQC